jgi:hypothetical protein
LAAGASGWKAGHEAVRSGALTLTLTLTLTLSDNEPALRQRIAAFAAEPARAYMHRMIAERGLTPAEGVHLIGVYLYAYTRGALDQALDGGALLHGS